MVGGYFCPCHGSKYNLAGRVFKGMPALVDMKIPSHKYKDGKLVIGFGYEG